MPARADFDVTLGVLAGTENSVAPSTGTYRQLHGKQRGMGGIRFRTKNVRSRVIRYFDRDRAFVSSDWRVPQTARCTRP